MNDPSFCSKSLAKLNQSKTKIAMCVSFSSILQKHSNWSELRNHISVRFSEMGGKHHVQEIPIRKATCAGRWPAGEKLQHRDRKMQLPLPPFIQLSDCHRVGSGSPGLASTSHVPAGRAGTAVTQIPVWGAKHWRWLSHGHWGARTSPCPTCGQGAAACPQNPGTPWAVPGKRAWERSPMPALKQPPGCVVEQPVLLFQFF